MLQQASKGRITLWISWITLDEMLSLIRISLGFTMERKGGFFGDMFCAQDLTGGSWITCG